MITAWGCAVRLPVVLMLLLLTGCVPESKTSRELEGLGEQIVDHWEARQEVADADYEYSQGLAPDDYHLRLEVTLKAEAVTDQVVDEIVEIGERDCWLGPWDTYYPTYVVRRTDGTEIRSGTFHLRPEMEQKWGPRTPQVIPTSR
ncbi:hypothetical protein SAMN04488564_11960 [Lentzea waywayandensis]|uniref:Uncharacterized protein n=1 Tax=Lentzea waywayandensis TaxID=84724 RepID=A0A1I6FHI9_9PSEU|nr:hypothetical protein SAMN04488564_11960 [Lentzea waywayandensis]